MSKKRIKVPNIGEIGAEWQEMVNPFEECWFKRGPEGKPLLHRESDLPARILYKKDYTIETELFYIDGVRIYQDGPIDVEYYASGTIKKEEYRNLEGELSRVGGPARINYLESGEVSSEEWYIDGIANRLDGPASIYYNFSTGAKTINYYINGVRIATYEEWLAGGGSSETDFYMGSFKSIPSPVGNFSFSSLNSYNEYYLNGSMTPVNFTEVEFAFSRVGNVIYTAAAGSSGLLEYSDGNVDVSLIDASSGFYYFENDTLETISRIDGPAIYNLHSLRIGAYEAYAIRGILYGYEDTGVENSLVEVNGGRAEWINQGGNPEGWPE